MLDTGYIIFRSRDAYMQHYKKSLSEAEELEINIITEQQMEFIEKHQKAASWNNLDQAESVLKMLDWNEALKERWG